MEGPSVNILELLKSLPHHASPGTDWLCSEHQYPWYARVFQTLSPKSILEIGTFLGYSLATAAVALPELDRVEWVDNEAYLEGSNRLAAENIRVARERAGYRPLISWSCREIPLDAAERQSYMELVHIDGDHRKDCVLRDLQYAFQVGTSCIIGHDYKLEGGVREAVVETCNRLDILHYVLDDFTHGLFVIPLVDHASVLMKLARARVGRISVMPPHGGK
jgi:hypothetical protein